MTRIAIVAVCYNTYEALGRFAESLRTALDAAPGVEFDFLVMDTSTGPRDDGVVARIHDLLPRSRYMKVDNVGYFPAFKIGFDTLSSGADYDFVAISNVDLEVAPTFFTELAALRLPDADKVGIVAPAILSKTRNNDSNPKTLVRPTRLGLRKNLFLFRHLWLLRWYQRLSALKARTFPRMPGGMLMYAPHGSFIIFTKYYFRHGGSVDYPRFLFGEEDFVGEQCRRIGATVKYLPDITVFDEDHGSTGQENLAFLASHHATSLDYIIRTYHANDTI
jgi:GT2 family glycosyltransferase